MSLLPPPKVGKLQKTLHAKAKGSPGYRFYALYDKVYRADVLWHAYRICHFNGGAPGVDGQTFEDIEAYGRMKWLGELMEELRTKRYCPAACPTGAYSQAGPTGTNQTAGNSDNQGSCRDDGCHAGSRTYLRSRLAAGTVRLPAGTQCAGRGSTRSSTAEIAALAGDRCGFVRLLRQYPARRTLEIGGSSHQRSVRLTADQDVA